MSTATRMIAAVATLVGFAAAAYLTQLHFIGSGTQSILCDALSDTGCEVALQSNFGSFMGVPLSLILMAVYVALGFALSRDRATAARPWATLALLTSVVLVGAGLFLLGVMAQSGHYCPLCLMMDGCNVVLALAWGTSLLRRGDSVVTGQSVLGFGAIVVIVTLGGAIIQGTLFPKLEEEGTPVGAMEPGELTVTACQEVELSALEISDFLCPYCKKLERNLVTVLSDCKAKVDKRFVHFPLDKACNRFVSRDLHPGACRLAEASECARLQGMFDQFSAALFENSPVGDAGLRKLAQENGLNIAEFQKCLSTGQTADRVRTDIELAHRLGVRSTPTFYLNGRRLEGALGAERLEREIAAALAKDVKEVKSIAGGAIGEDPWSVTEPVEACSEEKFSVDTQGCTLDVQQPKQKEQFPSTENNP